MDKTDNIFLYEKRFQLESGASLAGFELRYTTVGKLTPCRDNVVWVCHALTGNYDCTDWWRNLVKVGGALDPSKYFIICANTLGGCYGSTGPLSINPETGTQYFHNFPSLTNRDIVNAFDLLRESLAVEKIKFVIGGSLGGQQVLEWAICRSEIFDRIILIACNAKHSPWGIAFNEAQRMAIESDCTWREHHVHAGMSGLKAARAIGMLSYRNYNSFNETQSKDGDVRTDDFRASSYQRYQGEKLAKRFNAFSYFVLTKAMDSHNVGRGRGSIQNALRTIKANTLIIGIDSDILFPLTEQKFIASHIPDASMAVIESIYGHDAFLIEIDQLQTIIKTFLNKEKINIHV